MSDGIERREFLGRAAALLGVSALRPGDASAQALAAGAKPASGRGTRAKATGKAHTTPARRLPVGVGSKNALRSLERARQLLEQGKGPLEAAVEGVTLIEDDPTDHTVGLGGIPNEDGVVELDAACMDGATMRAGAVAALQRIQNPSRVAKLVLERTSRVLLVGEGALKFARAHGFPEVNLLTESSRKAWLLWKEKLNDRDDWMVGKDELDDPDVRKFYEAHKNAYWPQGTVHVSVVAPDRNLAGCTSTSGLYFKLAGRVGDSPIIGAGLYVDREVGAAGSTGRGEGNLQTLGSHTVVEGMRQGKSPEAAALAACERVVDLLLREKKSEPNAADRWNLTYYAVNRDGETGSASIWSGAEYAVLEADTVELRKAAFLYKREG